MLLLRIIFANVEKVNFVECRYIMQKFCVSQHRTIKNSYLVILKCSFCAQQHHEDSERAEKKKIVLFPGTTKCCECNKVKNAAIYKPA